MSEGFDAIVACEEFRSSSSSGGEGSITAFEMLPVGVVVGGVCGRRRSAPVWERVYEDDRNAVFRSRSIEAKTHAG